MKARLASDVRNAIANILWFLFLVYKLFEIVGMGGEGRGSKKKKGERRTIFRTLHDYSIIHPPIFMICTRRFPGRLIPLNSDFYSKPQQCDSPLIFAFYNEFIQVLVFEHSSKIKDHRNTHYIYFSFFLCVTAT